MFKLLKKLILFVLFLLVLALGALFMIDGIAKAAIEKGGSWALGTPTTVGSAKVSLLKGTFSHEDLKVANPEGFSSDPFLSIARGGTELTLGSLFKDVIDVPKLELHGLRLRIEQNLEKSNYGRILESLKRFEGIGKSSPGKRYVIREVVVDDIECFVNLLPIGGSLTTTTVKIPDIRLTDVGTAGNQGVALAELASILVKALFGKIAEVGAVAGIPGDITKEIGAQVSGLISLGGSGIKVLDQLGSGVKDAGKILEGVGDLFGGKKK